MLGYRMIALIRSKTYSNSRLATRTCVPTLDVFNPSLLQPLLALSMEYLLLPSMPLALDASCRDRVSPFETLRATKLS